jgi:uncharacterized Zn-binding protein involved in type VI secretion
VEKNDEDNVVVMVADSVTRLDQSHRGNVLIGGSHGGVIAGYLAAKAGVRAVILSDAGVGKDDAGISALPYLASFGMAAATVGHASARIADGADQRARGVISHANVMAESVGVVPGQSCIEAADRLRAVPMPTAEPPVYEEARFILSDGDPAVSGMDSVSLVAPEDADRVIIAGSHGALLGGRPDTALKVNVRAAVFNDAGGGVDDAGIRRLEALDGRNIPAAAVDGTTARIGDARSMWETGILSHVNETAAAAGAAPGQTVTAFAALFRSDADA